MKKALVSIVAIVMVFSLVACGGGDKSADLAGSYKMTSLEAAGMSVDVATMAEAAGLDADMLTLELKEDGSFTLNAFTGEGTDGGSGTWKADGNTVTLTMDGEDMTATVDGNKLTMEETQDGQTMKMVFEK